METIPVVDNEPEVLALATSILQAEGHTTLGTEDPREAPGSPARGPSRSTWFLRTL